MTPTAQKTKWGYKAVIVHPNGGRREILARKFRLSEDGRSMVQHRAGKNFETRDAALDYAQRTISLREQKHAEYMARYNARHAQVEVR